MLTIDVRNTTLPIAASEIISWIGQVVSTSYLYTQVAMVSVLLGGGQPKVHSQIQRTLHCLADP